MQLNDKGEVIWVQPHPSVTALIRPHTRSGIWCQLESDFDRLMASEPDSGVEIIIQGEVP